MLAHPGTPNGGFQRCMYKDSQDTYVMAEREPN